jgi:hypothetical protein
MFVICVKMELVLYDGCQLFDALPHISVAQQDPDVRVFTEIKSPNVSFDIWKSRLPVNLEI